LNRALWAFPVWLLCLQVTLAEMDVTEYQSEESVPSAAERERIRAEVEADREAARGHELAEQAEREVALRCRLAIEASQPYPQRLYHRLCLDCHPPDVLAQVGHTWPGWYLTIERMRWLNRAVMTSDEALAISRYLVKQQPLQGWQRLREYGLIALSLLCLPGIGYAGYRRHRRRAYRQKTINI
jgi:hypothetical protein